MADQLLAQNLASNGDFQQGANGWGDASWKRNGVALRSEASNAWLSLTGNSSISQHIALDPDWLSLRVTMRMRTREVVPGTEGWHDARLAMSFADRKGQHVDPWPNVFHAQGTTEWTRYERVFKVPPGAAALDLSPSMFGASGQAEFDDILVTVVGTRSGRTVDLPLPAGAEDVGEAPSKFASRSVGLRRGGNGTGDGVRGPGLVVAECRAPATRIERSDGGRFPCCGQFSI